jgi:hypothetical protein
MLCANLEPMHEIRIEWEVAAPQRLGILAIWFNVAGKGLPPRYSHKARPYRRIAVRAAFNRSGGWCMILLGS